MAEDVRVVIEDDRREPDPPADVVRPNRLLEDVFASSPARPRPKPAPIDEALAGLSSANLPRQSFEEQERRRYEGEARRLLEQEERRRRVESERGRILHERGELTEPERRAALEEERQRQRAERKAERERLAAQREEERQRRAEEREQLAAQRKAERERLAAQREEERQRKAEEREQLAAQRKAEREQKAAEREEERDRKREERERVRQQREADLYDPEAQARKTVKDAERRQAREDGEQRARRERPDLFPETVEPVKPPPVPKQKSRWDDAEEAARPFRLGGAVRMARAAADGTSPLASAGAALLAAELGARAHARALDMAGRAVERFGQIAQTAASGDHLGAVVQTGEAAADALGKIPIVGQAWAAQLGLATRTVRAFDDTAKAFIARGRELSAYSPDLALANARADVRQILGDIREAQRLGPATARLTENYSRFKEDLREALEPVKLALIEALNRGTDTAREGVEVAKGYGYLFDALGAELEQLQGQFGAVGGFGAWLASFPVVLGRAIERAGKKMGEDLLAQPIPRDPMGMFFDLEGPDRQEWADNLAARMHDALRDRRQQLGPAAFNQANMWF